MTIISVGVIVVFFAANWPTDEQSRRYDNERAILGECRKMMADARPGEERRRTRAMCDQMLAPYGKTMPP